MRSPRRYQSSPHDKQSNNARGTQKIVPPKPYRGYTPKNLQKFGTFAPAYTIGSSRVYNKDDEPTPGPGEYEVEDPKRNNYKKGHQISAKPQITYRTLTSDIIYPDLRTKSITNFTIGSRHSTYFYDPVCGTNKYIYQPTKLDKGAHICSRYKETPNTNPGPGEYTPRCSCPPKMSTINRHLDRRIYSESDSPGPGAYSPELPPSPRWFTKRRITKEKPFVIKVSDRDRSLTYLSKVFPKVPDVRQIFKVHEEVKLSLTNEEIQKYHAIFHSFDTESKERLNVSQIKELFSRAGVDMSKADQLLYLFDTEKTGIVTFQQFIRFMDAFNELDKNRPRKACRLLFDAIDLDHNAAIDKEEFKIFCNFFEMSLTDQEVDAIFEQFDIEKSGTLEFEEIMMYFNTIL